MARRGVIFGSLLLFFIFLSMISFASAQNCPSGYVPKDGKCYITNDCPDRSYGNAEVQQGYEDALNCWKGYYGNNKGGGQIPPGTCLPSFKFPNGQTSAGLPQDIADQQFACWNSCKDTNGVTDQNCMDKCNSNDPLHIWNQYATAVNDASRDAMAGCPKNSAKIQCTQQCSSFYDCKWDSQNNKCIKTIKPGQEQNSGQDTGSSPNFFVRFINWIKSFF